MSLMIKSVEASKAKMLPTERARFIEDLYMTGIITKAEYEILRRELV